MGTHSAVGFPGSHPYRSIAHGWVGRKRTLRAFDDRWYDRVNGIPPYAGSVTLIGCVSEINRERTVASVDIALTT